MSVVGSGFGEAPLPLPSSVGAETFYTYTRISITLKTYTTSNYNELKLVLTQSTCKWLGGNYWHSLRIN